MDNLTETLSHCHAMLGAHPTTEIAERNALKLSPQLHLRLLLLPPLLELLVLEPLRTLNLGERGGRGEVGMKGLGRLGRREG